MVTVIGNRTIGTMYLNRAPAMYICRHNDYYDNIIDNDGNHCGKH